MKNPAGGGVSRETGGQARCLGRCLERDDVGRLRTLGTVGHLIANFLAFGQALEAGAIEGAEVNKHIRAAVILGNETESLGIIEPFDCTSTI